MQNRLKLSFVIVLTIFNSCRQEIENETTFYSNSFENIHQIFSDLPHENYRNSRVLGRFNDSDFTIKFLDMPEHNYIRLSFDLLIHDTWDGNGANLKEYPRAGGPDIWGMEIDRNWLFETTFSNQNCNSNFCLFQSYPDSYPFPHNPRTGSSSSSRGVCFWQDRTDGTSRYDIEEIIPHNKQQLELRFYSKIGNISWVDPLCDESWSIDNLRINTITLE